MKTYLIPSQITTVEDRIFGNISVSQLILLVAPLVITVITFFVLPPNGHISIIKLVVIAVLGTPIAFLAIRLKGRLLVDWLILITRHNMRPRIYLYDGRPLLLITKEQRKHTQDPVNDATEQQKPQLNLEQLARLRKLKSAGSSQLVFKANKKGGLNVQNI